MLSKLSVTPKLRSDQMNAKNLNANGFVLVYLALAMVVILGFVALAFDTARISLAASKHSAVAEAAALLAASTYMSAPPSVIRTEEDFNQRMQYVNQRIVNFMNDRLSELATNPGEHQIELDESGNPKNLHLYPGTYLSEAPDECPTDSRGAPWCSEICNSTFPCFVTYQFGRENFNYGVNGMRLVVESPTSTPVRMALGKVVGVPNKILRSSAVTYNAPRYFYALIDLSMSIASGNMSTWGRNRQLMSYRLAADAPCSTGTACVSCDPINNPTTCTSPVCNFAAGHDELWNSEFYFDNNLSDRNYSGIFLAKPTASWASLITASDSCFRLPQCIPLYGNTVLPTPDVPGTDYPPTTQGSPIRIAWHFIGNNRDNPNEFVGELPKRYFKSDYYCVTTPALKRAYMNGTTGQVEAGISTTPARKYLTEDPSKLIAGENLTVDDQYFGAEPYASVLRGLYIVIQRLKDQQIPGDRFGVMGFDQKLGFVKLSGSDILGSVTNLAALDDPGLNAILDAVSPSASATAADFGSTTAISRRFDLGLFPDELSPNTALPHAISNGMFHVMKTPGFKSANNYLLVFSDFLPTKGCKLTEKSPGSDPIDIDSPEMVACRQAFTNLNAGDMPGVPPKDFDGERFRRAIIDVDGEGLLLDKLHAEKIQPMFFSFNAIPGEYLYKHPNLPRCMTRQEVVSANIPVTSGGENMSAVDIRTQFRTFSLLSDPRVSWVGLSSRLARKAIAYGGDFVQLAPPCVPLNYKGFTGTGRGGRNEIVLRTKTRIDRLCADDPQAGGHAPINVPRFMLTDDPSRDSLRATYGVSIVKTNISNLPDLYNFQGLRLERPSNNFQSMGQVGWRGLFDYNWIGTQQGNLRKSLPPIDITIEGSLRCDYESRSISDQITDAVSRLFKGSTAIMVSDPTH